MKPLSIFINVLRIKNSFQFIKSQATCAAGIKKVWTKWFSLQLLRRFCACCQGYAGRLCCVQVLCTAINIHGATSYTNSNNHILYSHADSYANLHEHNCTTYLENMGYFQSLGVPSPLCILELSSQIHIKWQSKHNYVYVIYKRPKHVVG